MFSGLLPIPDIARWGKHGRSVPCADIFFEANLVISRAARFKSTTKILHREIVHER
jgi:hypothetical protein